MGGRGIELSWIRGVFTYGYLVDWSVYLDPEEERRKADPNFELYGFKFKTFVASHSNPLSVLI
ncbi:hypothetical protein H5410_040122 [Solanum commersonii]|uniref:Uncharacterized protein n=1 Tax=Solanum commersonii TaxID=4109 RepID=A0A9J5XR64_SOLCO|nr:hypothetical protein H5410_040122 [Solanum commersonii]